MERKFYVCKHCHRVVESIVEGAPMVCCGEPMSLLEAGVTDAAREKHVPAVTREGNVVKVQVGSVEHPMTEAHLIQFIAVAQGNRTQRVDLTAADKPAAVFHVEDGPVTVYEFCNLHGLWKAEA